MLFAYPTDGRFRRPTGSSRRRHLATLASSAVALTLVASCSSGATEEVSTATSAASASAVASTSSTASSTTARAATTTAAPATTAAPTTTAAAVASGMTSISVPSTTEQYFVLFVKPVLTATAEIPVAIERGKAGTTTLTDGRSQLSKEHYRVETFSVAAPGDVDGDGIDDLTELADPVNANPLNPAPALASDQGAVVIPDRATFELLSYQGDQVAIDRHLAGLEFVKFWLVDVDTDHPTVYFMNTETYRAHPQFATAVGIPGGRGPQPGKMRGEIVYNAEGIAPDGSKGVYRFEFEPNDAYSFAEVALGYELLAASMPLLTNNLVYYPMPQAALPLYNKEKALYDAYRMPVMVEE